MKILHFAPQFAPELGGIASLMSQIVGALGRHEHVVVTSHGLLDLPDLSSVQGAIVHRLPFYAALETRNPAGLLRCKTRAGAIKRSFCPDVVHLCIGGPTAFLHTATAQDAPAPLIVTVCDLPANTAASPTLVEVLDSAAGIAAISHVRLTDLKRDVPTIVSRLRCIYPTVAPPQALPPVARDATPLLLTGGRHVADKGFSVVLDAMARIHAARPDVRLTITGDGADRSALEARSLALGLAGVVGFTGHLSTEDVRAWRHRAWVTLVPTLTQESFGLVALEAMQAGSPVVASRLEGLTEIVADGETGWLVPPGEPDALADAVLRIVESEDTVCRMGTAARARADAVFGWRSFVDGYEQLISDAAP